ncbi:DUF6438 domain-containing protein [Pedobacter xixiisoli]|uniref:DUF6438 domain-containing protein n=1 Tax=Pedobacter xixiisoli TaxID=1476464 RepID=A0A286A8Z9_9SPHI|nr:DUF6438 domain-containing protein [Pedobacter xixiisoli]SOD18390.1 hypothetical protein SAMN06297358_2975 [Pedobacter xixiisoli]
MKTKLLLIALMIVGLGFTSCKKDKTEAVEEIGYGTSFGMCVGYCLNEVAIINNGKITFTKRANGINPSTKSCTKTIDESEVNTLKALVNTNEFAKLPEVIGCPDCADGGAEWISLRVEGKVKKVTFEHGKAPNELKELAQKLKGIKESFGDCN